ncbi:FtsK/SpoIIIE family DNA translocase [Mangrovibrevibacter kandeliae]|uniref:FtsK/SpoIIIE family DNA translocase n=1 Tax=Mangrovibrevibacter kandeliae TaxID=2968473 RepID=UPI0021183CFC|nr:DNA translocase FtsK [Aurantimonas sp. CSK15Z-1]MCQ8781962.1 DNA translocase FtsK [Aurantimonas sp. CSK15Z-1]
MALSTIDSKPAAGFFMRQMQIAVALALLGLAGLLAVAFATWNVADPSLSQSNHNAVANLAGPAGAIFADLGLQLFGLAAALVAALPAIWGLSLLFGQPVDRIWRRAWLGFAGIVLAAAALGCLPAPTGWPLPIGLGGIAGDLVLKFPALATGDYPSGNLALALAVMIALPAGWLFLNGAGLIDRREAADFDAAPRRGRGAAIVADPEEDEEEGRFALLMGALAHNLYMARAAFARRFGGVGERVARVREAIGAGRGDDEWDFRQAAPTEAQPRAVLRPAKTRSYQPDLDEAADVPEDDEDWQDGAAAPAGAGDLPWDQDEDEEDDDWQAEAGIAGAAEDDGLIAAAGERMAPNAEADAPEAGGWRGLLSGNIIAFPGGKKRKGEPAPAPAARAPSAAATPQGGARVVPQASTPPATHKARTGSGRAVALPRHEEMGPFELPHLDFLTQPKARGRDTTLSPEALQENAQLLEGVLDDFGVKGEIIEVRPGPVVTLYELEPAPGIKSSRVIGLADDIARSMSAIAARVAVIPGKNAIGIELPNQRRETVFLREMVASETFAQSKAKLALTLGKTIGGEPVIADLAKMPHLLVAGTTGSGKSVAINTMILSLLYKLTPQQCRLIMIDPKMLELSVYDGIPHLLSPVVTDPKKAVVALKWTVREMEDRYRKMSKLGVRNIDGFNTRVAQAMEKGETISRTVQTGFDRETGEPIFESEEFDLEPLPYIVVIIDEMADLMMVAGKDIEGAVQRLAQMARAAGIHVIMATQRPSVDVITGTIKANFPTRISFQVTSKIDSRTILGEQGAEQLLGQGDMLFMAGGGRIQRVHGPFVDDTEVEQIVAHLKSQGVPDYLDAILEDEDEMGGDAGSGGGGSGGGAAGGLDESADLYDQAVAIVLRDGKASTSYVQRRLSIGYNRAASIIERMEKEGIVGPANHAGKREILVPTEEE